MSDDDVDNAGGFQQPRIGMGIVGGPKNLNPDAEVGEDDEENLKGPCDAFTYACSGKRVFGVGFWGRLCDNYLDPKKKQEHIQLLNSVKQHRPYFTYW